MADTKKQVRDLRQGDKIKGTFSGGKVCTVSSISCMVEMVMDGSVDKKLQRIRFPSDKDVVVVT